MREVCYICYYRDVFQDILDVLIEDLTKIEKTPVLDGEVLVISMKGSNNGLNELEKRISKLGLKYSLKNADVSKITSDVKIYVRKDLIKRCE